jgi:hypothetical protein
MVEQLVIVRVQGLALWPGDEASLAPAGRDTTMPLSLAILAGQDGCGWCVVADLKAGRRCCGAASFRRPFAQLRVRDSRLCLIVAVLVKTSVVCVLSRWEPMAALGLTGPYRTTAAIARVVSALTVVCATTVLVGVVRPPSASAATLPVSLGAAADFAVLAGTTVTNTGLTTITGDLGVSPGTAVTGFPPGQVVNGTIHSNDGPAVAAHSDLVLAYNDAVGRPTTDIVSEVLGGTTKTSGVYGSASGTFDITGTVTLDAQGDPNAAFIFQTLTTVITAASSAVNLVNGAQSCNVFWQIGSSATLGASSVLRGNLLAFTSITGGAGVQVDGRALAINAAVTLDTDAITRPACTSGALSVSVPATAALGSAPRNATVSAHLGPVTVTDTRSPPTATWTATVIATNFITGTGSPTETISNVNVTYWSGMATSTAGEGDFTSGQPTSADAQTINVERTAYSHTNGTGNNAATWNPTVSVHIPAAAVAGTYTGTVTFSVF